MKANKKTVLSTAAVLGVVALAVGGTIAYFTDNDSKTNNFTVGNVDVTLYESQLHRVNANMASPSRENSLTSAALADNYHVCSFTNASNPNYNPYCTPNITAQNTMDGVSAWTNGHVRAQNAAGVTGAGQSGVFSDAQIIADSQSSAEATATASGGYADYTADEYSNLVPGKQVRKFAYVKNTGENPAYVRVKVTIPASVANYVTVKAPHTPQETSTPTGNTNINGDAMNYAYVTESDETLTDGTKVMTFIFTDALQKDEMTYWSPITTVKINDDVLESTIGTTALTTLRTTGFGVTVDVDAIQSEGFASATAAFSAFDGQTGSENEENV